MNGGTIMKSFILEQEQIMAYGKYLRENERSLGTVEKYLRDANELAEWLGGCPITKEAMINWKSSLQEKGYATTTINSKLTAVNGLLRFYGLENCCVRLFRLQRRVFRQKNQELTKEEYIRLVKTAHNKKKTRLALLLETICTTGIRVSEVQYITVQAARYGRAEITLKGKIRTILLPRKLCQKLLKYARKQKISSGQIFLTRNGHGLSRKQIWSEMKHLCSAAAVAPSKVFPHNLRHLFATMFYRACKDIVLLADVLGHSNIDTTRIYLLTTGKEHSCRLERLGLIT